MNDRTPVPPAPPAKATMDSVRRAVSRCVVGMEPEIDLLLCALLAGRHVLVEGVPGLGKTHLVHTLAMVVGCTFRRIQFTPDLLPADIVGAQIYRPSDGTFALRKGPIFTQVLLADEINRAPAKTQSALLEAMQERQVTIEGDTLPLGPPFFVFATQNPIEHEGVYPLPQAQLDRFAMRLLIGFPSVSDERRILAEHRTALPAAAAATDADALVTAQAQLPDVRAADEILSVIVDLVRATRTHPALAMGAGPRLGIDLLHLARARAVLHGRDHVLPDDIKALFAPAANHRLVLTPRAELSGITTMTVIHETLAATRLV